MNQACVKRRATNSVSFTKGLSKKDSEAVINQVFHSCFYDYEPYKKIPWLTCWCWWW